MTTKSTDQWQMLLILILVGVVLWMFMKNHTGGICSLFGGNKETFIISGNILSRMKNKLGDVHNTVADKLGSVHNTAKAAYDAGSKGGSLSNKLKKGWDAGQS